MKNLLIYVCCALYLGSYAQTPATKSYATKPGQQVNLKFDYPVVKVSTWEKNEVSVIAHVNINDHENDNAFELEQLTESGALVITDHIKDINNLPRRYTVVRNGKKTIYRSKEQYQEAIKGGGAESSYEGSNIEIVLEIKVPANAVTEIHAVYGIVELKEFNAPVTIDATYGGIDATIAPAHTGHLVATTHYGQIYTNLDLKLTDHKEENFFSSITAAPGTGPAYSFTSAYGKIYLRKP